MGPDPTPACFWPALNKGPTWLWPGYSLTLPNEIFFPEGKKIKNLGFLEEVCQISRWLTPPDPGQKNLAQAQH